MFNVRLAGDMYGKITVHLDVAGDVFSSVLFCAVRLPTRCLG